MPPKHWIFFFRSGESLAANASPCAACQVSGRRCADPTSSPFTLGSRGGLNIYPPNVDLVLLLQVLSYPWMGSKSDQVCHFLEISGHSSKEPFFIKDSLPGVDPSLQKSFLRNLRSRPDVNCQESCSPWSPAFRAVWRVPGKHPLDLKAALGQGLMLSCKAE